MSARYNEIEIEINAEQFKGTDNIVVRYARHTTRARAHRPALALILRSSMHVT